MSLPLPAPIRRLFDECEIGLTLGRKVRLTLLIALYVISPLDLAPDVVPICGQADDLVAVILLVRVLCSPTLSVASTAASTFLESRGRPK